MQLRIHRNVQSDGAYLQVVLNSFSITALRCGANRHQHGLAQAAAAVVVIGIHHKPEQHSRKNKNSA